MRILFYMNGALLASRNHCKTWICHTCTISDSTATLIINTHDFTKIFKFGRGSLLKNLRENFLLKELRELHTYVQNFMGNKGDSRHLMLWVFKHYRM